jgi:dimethylargininase
MHHPTYAIVSTPSDTLPGALRMREGASVNLRTARLQHERYCAALRNFGFSLVWLSPDNRYPDSVFVEDPAVAIEETLVVSRLRRKERSGEESRIRLALAPFFGTIETIRPPGFLEGGDVLLADRQLYIGLSQRTNPEGAEQLARIAQDRHGWKSRMFRIPSHYLHLKGEVTYHRASPAKGPVMTVSEEIAGQFRTAGCPLLVTPADERFGGNCISANGRFLIHAGRPKTKKILSGAGYDVTELAMSEFEKIDGALTCLSKFF